MSNEALIIEIVSKRVEKLEKKADIKVLWTILIL